ncbi:hypothetical protein [Nitriliruptor alkaliphilus]|uniref:hypothetical protein n=1 Tax=Nitriliruptor alkaliphilus TaxID=427918 RepID=UPI0006962AF1|nr:hypothetical protein [Nitriliruptor alkaliphilus]
MSDASGPLGPSGGQPGGPSGDQPSEEEVRAYLGQLRAAPAGQVVAEVVSALLNAAQVKLGRRDGRLLLDLSVGVVDGARPHLPAELLEQVDQVLAQLQLAQVEAEREVAAAAAQGHQEPGDLGGDSGDTPPGAAPGADATSPPPASPPQDPPGAGSRLWVPGR